MKGEKFFIQVKLWIDFIYNVGKKEGREKKIAQTAGKLKRKKDKKSNYTRNLLTGFRDTINNNSSTTEQNRVESVYLTVYYKVYLEFYCCLIEVMLHESCLLSCLCGSSEKQLAP